MSRRARGRRRAGRTSPPSLAISALLAAIATAATGLGGYGFVVRPYTWSQNAVSEAHEQGWELAVSYERSDWLRPWSHYWPYPATLGFTRRESLRRDDTLVRAETWWWSLGHDGEIERWQSAMLFHCVERAYTLVGVDTELDQLPEDASASWSWLQMTPELVEYFCRP